MTMTATSPYRAPDVSFTDEEIRFWEEIYEIGCNRGWSDPEKWADVALKERRDRFGRR